MKEILVQSLGWEDSLKKEMSTHSSILAWKIPWIKERVRLLQRLSSKESAFNAEMQAQSLGWEDPLEEGMATQSNILAWRIPWTEEPGRL